MLELISICIYIYHNKILKFTLLVFNMEAFINIKNNEENKLDNMLNNMLNSQEDKDVHSDDKNINKYFDNSSTNISSTNILSNDNSSTDNSSTNLSTNNSENIDSTFNGLNLLCDPRKKKNFNIGKVSSDTFYSDLKNFNIEIDEFKKFIIERIIKFDINKRIDYYDEQILSCYYHFIYRNIDKNKLYNFICSFKE